MKSTDKPSNMEHSSLLFKPLEINGLTLKNRITMAPMSVGYGNSDGTVSTLCLEHYRDMAASGVAMVVVENTAVHATGLSSLSSLRADDEMYLPGLASLARAIHDEGALAFLQINHAGRHALGRAIAPSPVSTGDAVPIEMTPRAIDTVADFYASAAALVKDAGFDGVEINGAMGYLLVQFLSPRTNFRKDEFGGALENRMRFPLMILNAVREAVGTDFPVGYRFLADEWLPDGLHPEETSIFAAELDKRGVAYLSVTAGTYDSFFTEDYMREEQKEAYMAHFAAEIKGAVQHTPIIASGRIRTPETAERILRDGGADLIGLARVLFADPRWLKKATGLLDEEIVECEHSCTLCTKRGLLGLAALCPRWDKEHRSELLDRVKAIEEEEGATV